MAPGAESFVRKTVTVLFCDVTGFTSLGERMDPETMRRVMLHYFDEVRTVLERHGGTVEKFIGDAVMAVFGVPVVHEDDALRAVRAADEMRRALGRLNVLLDERFGVRLEERIGINTGEVVVGDPTTKQTVATGDAVNVAARLQQAAQPGEILLGKETYRLVADRVRAGALDTFQLKGKSEPVPSWRLDEVRAGVDLIFRRLDSPLVGRDHERDRLHSVYRATLDEQSCRLVTVLGAAGVGKTRLAQEVAARSFGATVAQGRCLSYGEGITFFPVTQIVRSLAGLAADDDEDVVRGRIAQLLPNGDEVALVTERLVELLKSDADVRAEEVFWAVRKLLEAVARVRPLLLVLEDVHWAEPTVLDLVEYLVGWSRGVPILVVALARPDLLELRPAWPGEHLLLEPLAAGEVQALLVNLLGSAELDAEIASRIELAAEGNPLFVEELVRMLLADGALVLEEGRWVARDVEELPIPPSISALLAARLDRLDPGEKVVLQCASVIGKEFWWSAVADLAPEDLRGRVSAHLHALVRRRLVFPAESTSFVTEDSFRFGHILVRDAAYATLPKAQRADLHARFADWLDRRRSPEEIRGHHLDQAYRARCDLGMVDEETALLGERAGAVIASAGQRAFAREDMRAAARLLTRAVELLPEGGARREALRDLSAALWVVGEHQRADAVLEDALERAVNADDRRIEWYARLERAGRRDTRAEAPAEELESVARDAIPVFEELQDDLGLARAWRRIAYAAERRCSFAAASEASERALVHVKRAGSAQDEARVVDRLCMALLYGPTHVTHAMRRCDEILRSARPNLLTEANVLGALSGLRAMAGRFDAARAAYHRAHEIYDELGLRLLAGSLTVISGPVELTIGNPAAAEAELRLGVEIARETGFSRALGEDAALLAVALHAQDKRAEAAEFVEVSRNSAASADIAAQVLWRCVQARLDVDEELARDAVALADETDALSLRGDTRVSLADVLEASGVPDEAAVERERARALYTRKGNVAAAWLLARTQV